jgi:8-oxo-dGTP diphosphatase
MVREHRISAGAIIIEQGKILLVRYNDSNGNSYLVGPGGGTLENEEITQTVVREVHEETGLEVNPQRILFIEDLLSHHYRMVKIWFLCNIVGGKLENTQGAADEGITDAKWYRKDQLRNEVVYPAILLKQDWSAYFNDNWKSICLGMSVADF